MITPGDRIGRELSPSTSLEQRLARIERTLARRRILKSPGVLPEEGPDGTKVRVIAAGGSPGESGTLQFRGEWSDQLGYSQGDIVILGSNNARGPGPPAGIAAIDILRNGHTAGTYIALVDIPAPAPLSSNPSPGEPDTTGKWETFARGAWHFLSVKPTDATKTHGISLDGRGDYVGITVQGTNGRTVTIDVEHPLRPLRANAQWIEIDVCQDGVAKKMQVLGTAPYIP